jgi:DNA repair protein RadC
MLELPVDERPRERCLHLGAYGLSTRELLAVLLGSGPPGVGALGLAGRVLERPGEGLAAPEAERALFTALEAAGDAHLREIAGLGAAGRARLLAAFELGRRYAVHRERRARPRPPADRMVDLPERALDRIPPSRRAEAVEWLGFVPVHRSGELGQFCLVERGTRTHVNIDPAELFARVLALRPRAFYLFHNHPSGQLRPSLEDVELTRRVERLARPLGLALLGHAVVGTHGERWVVV